MEKPNNVLLEVQDLKSISIPLRVNYMQLTV